jgi:hypothetical protein
LNLIKKSESETESIFEIPITKVESVQTTNSAETLDSTIRREQALDDEPDHQIVEAKKVLSNNEILELGDDTEIINDPKQIILLAKEFPHNNNVNSNIKTNFPIDPETFYTSNSDFLVLSNLTLLTKISPNVKLTINTFNNDVSKYKINFELGIENSYLPVISRWYRSQGRIETINALNKLIDVSIEQYTYYSNTNNNINKNKYYDLLEKSIKGLSNLKITYSSDFNVSIEIDRIISKITNALI